MSLENEKKIRGQILLPAQEALGLCIHEPDDHFVQIIDKTKDNAVIGTFNAPTVTVMELRRVACEYLSFVRHEC